MNDQPQTPDPWEEALSRSLKKLPDPQAPDTLMPRVMEAVAAQERSPWPRLAWRRASSGQRLAVAALASAFVALPLVYFLPSRVPSECLASLEALRTVSDALDTVGAAVCEGCARWAAAGVIVLMFAMYLTCLALGTAAYQIVRRH